MCIINLISSDNKEFKIEKEYIEKSIFIKNMLEDIEKNKKEIVIQLFIGSNTLEEIVKWCKNNSNSNKWNENILFDIIINANYLHINDLLNFCCKKLAEILNNKFEFLYNKLIKKCQIEQRELDILENYLEIKYIDGKIFSNLNVKKLNKEEEIFKKYIEKIFTSLKIIFPNEIIYKIFKYIPFYNFLNFDVFFNILVKDDFFGSQILNVLSNVFNNSITLLNKEYYDDMNKIHNFLDNYIYSDNLQGKNKYIKSINNIVKENEDLGFCKYYINKIYICFDCRRKFYDEKNDFKHFYSCKKWKCVSSLDEIIYFCQDCIIFCNICNDTHCIACSDFCD